MKEQTALIILSCLQVPFSFYLSASQFLLGAFNFQALPVIAFICPTFHLPFLFVCSYTFSLSSLSLDISFAGLFLFVTYHLILLFSFSLRLILNNMFFLMLFFFPRNEEEIQDRGGKHCFCTAKTNLGWVSTMPSFLHLL